MNRRTAIVAILALPVLPRKRPAVSALRDGQIVVANLHGLWVRLRVDGNKLRVVGGSGFLPREHLDAFEWKCATH